MRRDPEDVLDDVAGGWISLKSAADDYGVIVIMGPHGTMTIDTGATERRRSELGAMRPVHIDSAPAKPPVQADPNAVIPPHSLGRWVEIVRAWHDSSLTQCDLCGRLIPRQGWQVECEGERLMFCNDGCEALYWSYWYPRYGSVAVAS